MGGARVLDAAGLEQVVDAPVLAERLQLALADRLRQLEQLLAQPQPLVEVVDVQQRGVARLERDQPRARVVEPVRHLQRLGAQLLRAAAGRTESDQPRAQAHAQQAVARLALERLLEQRAGLGSSTPASAWRPE